MADRASLRLLLKWLAAALLLAVAGWVGMESQRILRADWSTQAARAQVERWLASDRPAAEAEAWAATEAALLGALKLTPDDPGLLEKIGNLHAIAGVRDWEDATLRRDHHQRAAAHYEAALALRPGSALAWAGLASARQAIEDSPARVHAAWRNGLRQGPLEEHVQPILMQVVLADWTGAAPEMQEWAKNLFDVGDRQTRAQINTLAKYYGLHFEPDESSRKP